MKNTALVTISTIRRTWVLSLGKATQLFLLFITILIICSMSLGAVLLYKFNDNIDLLESKKSQLEHNIIMLNSSADVLQQKIQSQEFTLVKLQELEELAGMELEDASADSFVFSSDAEGLSDQQQDEFLERIDNAKTSLAERNWLLQTIPSGIPLTRKTYVTSNFGLRLHPVTKKKQMHYGIDLGVAKGDNVIASADGVVEFSSFNRGGYGHMVRIRHSYGFTTVYAHLDERLVKFGEPVAKGQVIAKAGSSGISTGPHLHYEVHFLKKKVNPVHFLNWSLGSYDKLFVKEKNVRWSMLIEQVKHHLKSFQNTSDALPASSKQVKNN